MKLQVLMDNCTLTGRRLLGEPGFSVYLEDGDLRLLLDTGASGVFLENAEALGLSLDGLRYVVLSHGHHDHSGGLQRLWERCDLRGTELLAHSDAFLPRLRAPQGQNAAPLPPGNRSNGIPYPEETIREKLKIRKSRTPVRLSSRLVFLGEIPRTNDFEAQHPLGEICRGGVWEADYLLDDTALAYMTDRGVFVITGCSHSGICNIIEYAKHVCAEDRVCGVIGGFHLREPGETLNRTVCYLKECRIPMLYPCHCVSLAAKCALAGEMPIGEAGVGTSLELTTA